MNIRLVFASLLLALAYPVEADDPVERDVVYGMLSGLALLMDVHHPTESNGRGVLFIAGTGFEGGEAGFTDFELKLHNPNYYEPLIRALTDAGFVVFSVNH